jgi:two-component system, OmpR family, phosphate regulon response regulator PhoB
MICGFEKKSASCNVNVTQQGYVHSMKSTILIIEDERDLRDILEYNLKKEGYEVCSAGTGAEGMKRLDSNSSIAIVVLDLMLPDISGIEICRQIRNRQKIAHLPVLMLTARGEEIDKVVGFEVGADDYVTKPFSVRELLLRIRALIKRSATRQTDSDEVVFGVMRIDFPGHRVFVHDQEKMLTALEFSLLKVLFQRKGRVQTRDMLLSDVWDITADVTTRTVDTHVKRLREKIGDAGSYVETVRGVGYRFAESKERSKS